MEKYLILHRLRHWSASALAPPVRFCPELIIFSSSRVPPVTNSRITAKVLPLKKVCYLEVLELRIKNLVWLKIWIDSVCTREESNLWQNTTLSMESRRLLAKVWPIVNGSDKHRGVSGKSELSGAKNCTLHPLAEFNKTFCFL